MGAHASTVFGSLGGAVSDDAAKLVGLEVNEIKALHSRFTELHVCPGVDLALFTTIFQGTLADHCEKVCAPHPTPEPEGPGRNAAQDATNTEVGFVLFEGYFLE